MDHTIQFERAPTAAESNRLFFLHVRNYLRSRDTFNDAIFLMMGVGIGRFVYHAKVGSSYFSKIDNTIVAHSISPYCRFLKWSVTPMGSPLAMEMCGTFMPSQGKIAILLTTGLCILSAEITQRGQISQSFPISFISHHVGIHFLPWISEVGES